jgi:hypothetical protein
MACARAGRRVREAHDPRIGFVGLNPRALLGERLPDQRLHVRRVFVPRQQDAGIGFHLLQVTHPQVIPGIGVSGIQSDRPLVRSRRKTGPSRAGVGLTQPELRLYVRGLRKRRVFEIRNRLAESLQLHVHKSEKQTGNEQSWLQPKCLAKCFAGQFVLPRLVVHQAKVGSQFCDLGPKADRLPVELRRGFKITCRLGLLCGREERLDIGGLLRKSSTGHKGHSYAVRNEAPARVEHAAPVPLSRSPDRTRRACLRGHFTHLRSRRRSRPECIAANTPIPDG